MSKQLIPAGIQTFANLMDVDPKDFWTGLKYALTTPEKIALFNKTVADTIAEFQDLGMDKKEMAEEAMNRAGEAIFGPYRPIAPDNSVSGVVDTMVNSGLFLKEVPMKKKKNDSSQQFNRTGGFFN